MPTRLGPDSAIGYRRQRSIAEFWRDWFDGESQSLDDLFNFRVRVAWRIVREVAAARGVLTERRQTLAEVTKIYPTPWDEPFHFYSRMGEDPVVNGICQERMLPLLPPDIPALHVNGRVDDGYDPSKDESLLDFIRVAEHVSTRRLFIPRSREGKLGLAGLFDPDLARLAWPTPVEIMSHELNLVHHIYSIMIRVGDGGGDNEAMAELRAQDLLDHEILQVLAMARAHAAEATGLDDPESYFMMQIAKLDALADKQSSREDYRGAAQTKRDSLRLLAGRASKDEAEDYDAIVEGEIGRAKKRLPKPSPDDTLGTDPQPPSETNNA